MQTTWITQTCPTPSESARSAAIARQVTLTKPAGSLGQLETLATDFAAWQDQEKPELNTIIIRVFAADHGVCAQGVSAFPQDVTAQMVLNFVNGGAAISVLAKQLNADFRVINMGTVAPVDLPADNTHYEYQRIANNTADFSQTSAMNDAQLTTALEIGRSQVSASDLFIGGEMGIGNTSSASAICAALLGLTAADTVGPGTGLNQDQQAHKAKVIDTALKLHQTHINSPLAVLKNMGGFEIAALTGAYIAAAQQRIPVLVDGFICTAAALLASSINPSARAWMLFAHQSAEPAHVKALNSMNATPLLDLKMRLGEGSGAAIAVPLIQSALELHTNMATFSDAGVSEKDA